MATVRDESARRQTCTTVRHEEDMMAPEKSVEKLWGEMGWVSTAEEGSTRDPSLRPDDGGAIIDWGQLQSCPLMGKDYVGAKPEQNFRTPRLFAEERGVGFGTTGE